MKYRSPHLDHLGLVGTQIQLRFSEAACRHRFQSLDFAGQEQKHVDVFYFQGDYHIKLKRVQWKPTAT